MSRRTTKAISTVVTVLLLLAVWWLQSRDDEAQPSRARDTPSATPTQEQQRPEQPEEQARPERDEDGLPYVDLDDLPPEAAETVELIDAGGPYPYPGKDGSTFGNFEGLLPERERGYYAEFTVETPGLDHRGARRIIAGDGGELYWTADHYESFERLRR